jgi:hypothetical protein
MLALRCERDFGSRFRIRMRLRHQLAAKRFLFHAALGASPAA